MSKLFELVWVDLYWNDNREERHTLCAIGDYDENDILCQEWDEQIFYWFENEQELIDHMIEDDLSEFTVTSYEKREWRE